MKTIFASACLLAVIMCSCTSNNESSVPEKEICPICEETELTKDNSVNAQTKVGQMKVCRRCYSMGQYAGYCY